MSEAVLVAEKMLIYGHNVLIIGDPGSSECDNCGAHATNLPCPRAESCTCSSMRRSGFTNVGDAEREWWVCPECGRPTTAWLEATLEAAGLTPGQYLSEDESTIEVDD